MGLARKKHISNTSAVATVFRQGARYVCGMCRITFDRREDAKACMRQNIADMVARQPVKPVKSEGVIKYMCVLCKRKHRDPNTALACAADCKSVIDQLENQEDRVSGAHIKAPIDREFRKKPQLVPVLVQPRANKTKTEETGSFEDSINQSKLQAVEDPVEEQKSVEDSSESAPTDDSSSNAPEEKDELYQRKVEYKAKGEKFYRKDAKYICNVCRQDYFTKIEVEKCFDEHPPT